MSSPRVSIIVPVLNEAGVAARLLARLREGFPDAELVVVDGGSTDGTAEQVASLCDEFLCSAPGRARQMNLGADRASGEYHFFLHADCTPLFDGTYLAEFLATSRPAWGFCPVRLSGPEQVYRIIGGCMNIRSRLTRVATGDQMQFVRADIFARTSGLDELPLMEDVAYSKRLRKLSPPAIMQQAVLVSTRRWRERGVARTVLTMWALRLAYVVGVAPSRLWRVYYGE